MVEDAILLIRQFHHLRDTTGEAFQNERELYCYAAAWILGAEADITFFDACGVLHLDPSAVRRSLRLDGVLVSKDHPGVAAMFG